MRPRPMLVALTLAAVARATVPAAARAETPSQEELARSHFVAGEEEYARGRWREALHEFELGYALSPRPEFLINFAQVYRKLGDFDAAERECERYLATAPPPELAQQAERLLLQIRDERKHAPPATPSPPPVASSPSSTVPPQTKIVQTHNEIVRTQNQIVQTHNEAPQPRRRRWVVPVVVGSVLVVGAAVTLGLVFGLDKRDTFKPAPLGTVDFR